MVPKAVMMMKMLSDAGVLDRVVQLEPGHLRHFEIGDDQIVGVLFDVLGRGRAVREAWSPRSLPARGSP